ncbi:glycoside hydrolase family 15 protein [Sorangium sp. So ce119]
MPAPIEHYGLIGDTTTVGLISRNGSLDWLCLPRVDSDACFARLLGHGDHGYWTLRPATRIRGVERRYRPDTLVLETEFSCDSGRARLIDFMPPWVAGHDAARIDEGTQGVAAHDVIRIVEGIEGPVAMHSDPKARFGHGRVIPWIRCDGSRATLTSGPAALAFSSPAPLDPDWDAARLETSFIVRAGQRLPFTLTCYPSHERAPDHPVDAERELARTERHWRAWASRCPYQGRFRDHFTHSKLMAWVAVDRAVRMIEEFGVGGQHRLGKRAQRWRALREEIRNDLLTRGFNARVGAFTQSYGSDALDASVLLIPHMGFLAADDPRMLSTVAAIEKGLTREGLVLRYATETGVDGLPGHEGTFLICSFWLADNYAMAGRLDDAEALLDRLVSLCNDVGLLSEEYSPELGRQLGNFPQAFSHIGLVNAAHIIDAKRAGRELSLPSAA